MWDYLIFLGFDKNANTQIEALKVKLYENDVFSSAKSWPPHITIDLYQDIQLSELISIVDKIVDQLKPIDLTFKNLNDFNQTVLYLEPANNNELQSIKQVFDEKLGIYTILDNKREEYIPHVTLLINEDITKAKNILTNSFTPIHAKATHLFIFAKDQTLVKSYELN